MDFEEMHTAYTKATESQVNVKWDGWRKQMDVDYVVVQVESGYLLARSRDGLGSLIYTTIAHFPNYEDAIATANVLNKSES